MSIVVCVPWMKMLPQFIESYMDWYAYSKERFALIPYWKFYKALHTVQRGAVELARKREATHILFIEDDQWMFPEDGLDYLLEADKDVIGFPTYFREYPYYSMAMDKKDPSIGFLEGAKNLNPVYPKDKQLVQKVDFLTWGFTLVKTDVFDRLHADPFDFWGKNGATDSNFMEYCELAGIERYIHWAAIINHGPVSQHEIPQYREMYRRASAEMQHGATVPEVNRLAQQEAAMRHESQAGGTNENLTDESPVKGRGRDGEVGVHDGDGVEAPGA